MVVNTLSDEALWNSVQDDDTQAFEKVVSRHQTAVSAVTFSCLGDFAASEDIAQETFLVAWQGRNTLEDSQRLRAWLCGIARNLSKNYVRKIAKQRAQNEKVASESPTADLRVPEARVMEREEQTLVWQTLESINETYREPLVLYYRDGQSVGSIAQALNISEDAAKQRLARGRKLLKESVAQVVGDTLEQTRPGRGFTSEVMAAIAIGGTTATTAKTALSGTSAVALAAKIANLLNVTKAAGILTTGGAAGLLGGLGGAAGGFLGGWLGGWLPAQLADTEEERKLLEENNKRLLKYSVVFTLLIFASTALFALPNGVVWALVALASNMIWFASATIYFTLRATAQGKELALQTGGTPNASPYKEALQRYSHGYTGRKFRSKAEFLGIPLIDVNVSDVSQGHNNHSPRTAFGWIAIGDRAKGILIGIGRTRAYGLFAMGGLAVGGVCLGGISCGIISIGGLAVGALAIGGATLGGWAAGGLAVAFYEAAGCVAAAMDVAIGAVAFAADTAVGAVAVAQDFAAGAVAYADVVDTKEVLARVSDTPLWQLVELPSKSPVLFGLCIAAIVAASIAHPFVLYSRTSSSTLPGDD